MNRDEIYRGRIVKLVANDVTRAFAAELCERIAISVQTPLRAPPGPDFLPRLDALRSTLAAEPRLVDRARDVMRSHGWDEQAFAVDRPRIRAIVPGGHEIPAAAPVYVAHRDTWYANPRAQINWWLALHDVDESETFEIFPDLLEQAVPNDSAHFDYDQFLARAGWQSRNRDGRAVYPSAELPTGARSFGFSASAGEVLVFAGAHLHRTRAHRSEKGPRFSVDFRAVHLDDHRRGLGANVIDDRSTGHAMREYALPRGER